MDNQRLILFLVFSFSLFMLWQAWQKQGTPVPVANAPATTALTKSTGDAAAPVPVPSVDTIPAVAGTAAPVDTAARMVVTTDLFVAEISAQGGDLTRLELKRHKATGDRENNFVLFETKHSYAAQGGLIGPGLPNHKTIWQLPASGVEMKDGEQELRVRLTASLADGATVVKAYVFKRDNYLIDVEYDVTNGGTEAIAPFAYFQLIRDGQPPEGANSMMMTFTGPAFYTDADKFQKVSFEDAAKGKGKVPGKTDNGWVAMVQHYFVSAWLPGQGEREFFLREVGKDLFAAGVIVPMASIAPQATGRVSMPLYAGPQEQDKLSKIAPGFDLVVDYGWLTVIAAPIFWVLEWVHSFVGNWGWSIILLTVLIKAAFFPLSAASYKSMAKMRLLTPKLQKLKEAYGDDKQRMNQEMMELYKKEKVNPLGGCLPILVQIPVFIALYWVLMGTVEMRGAPWVGWITDLSTKDPYFVMPLIMGATMLIQTKLNPAPPDPMQAKIMMMMPIVFTAMFLFFPAGLVLYWTVNNLLSIAQQWQVNRMIEASGLKAK
ncbi:MAG: membrane protein insertase YidC [Gammaproteobacteria bacterium]|nr:membrane protein insertase YidC [Gammaproteobacteria bacterium]MBU1415984.1 membrane protein insertase YidC [Gammaproteobacteria bacterium]